MLPKSTQPQEHAASQLCPRLFPERLQYRRAFPASFKRNTNLILCPPRKQEDVYMVKVATNIDARSTVGGGTGVMTLLVGYKERGHFLFIYRWSLDRRGRTTRLVLREGRTTRLVLRGGRFLELLVLGLSHLSTSYRQVGEISRWELTVLILKFTARIGPIGVQSAQCANLGRAKKDLDLMNSWIL